MEKGMVINLRLFFSSKKWTGIKTINKLSVHFSKENNSFGFMYAVGEVNRTFLM